MDSEPTWKQTDPIAWTLELVKCLEGSDYKVSRDVDYLIDSILGGFITEFSIDTYVSYREAEQQFFKGPRGKYLTLLKTYSKLPLCKKGIMPLS